MSPTLISLAKLSSCAATLLGLAHTDKTFEVLKNVFDFVATGGEGIGGLGGPDLLTMRSAMERSRGLVETAYQDALRGTHSAGFAETVDAAFASLGEVFERCLPSGAEMVRLRHDPEAIGRHVADAAVALDMEVFRDGEGRKLLITVVVLAYTALDRDPSFMAALERLNWKEALQQLDAIRAGTDTLIAGQRRIEHDVRQFRIKIDELTRDLQLTNAQREQLAVEAEAAREKLGSTIQLITGFLKTIVGQEIPPDQIAATLFRLAADWQSTGRRLDALDRSNNLGPDIARLKDQARIAYANEDVAAVEQLLLEIDRLEEAAFATAEAHERAVQARKRQIESEEREARDDVAVRREALVASKTARFDFARSQLNHAEAAELIWQIVQLSVSDPAERFAVLRGERDGYYVKGRDKGLNASLALAIELARICVRKADGLDEHGIALNDFGTALATLGQREAGTARLLEAVAAYRAAIEERTREREPLQWAMTLNNLGNALAFLGGRETGTARLEDAVAAYRAALEERTRERDPLKWALTQMNLGNVLHTLGAREAGTERLEEAAVAFRGVLEEYTRERMPLGWATTQNNLGNTLAILGGRETGTARLEDAVAAYRGALEEHTRERVPLDWAMTQNNLGNALATLGSRVSGTARLKDAVAAYRAALEERTRERVPLDWASTQHNLGSALASIGLRGPGTERLEAAAAAYRAALEERTRDRVPLQWEATTKALAEVLAEIDRRRSGGS